MIQPSPVSNTIKVKIEDRSQQMRYRLGRCIVYAVLTLPTLIVLEGISQKVSNWEISALISIFVFIAYPFFIEKFAGIHFTGTPLRLYFPYLPSTTIRAVEIHFIPSKLIWSRIWTLVSFKKKSFRNKLKSGQTMCQQAAEAIDFSLRCGYPKVSVESHLIKLSRVDDIVSSVKALNAGISVEVVAVKSSVLNHLFLVMCGVKNFSTFHREYARVIFTAVK